jgi:hypothetical protein
VSGYEFVVTCGACGGDLADVVHGGSGPSSSALAKCTCCGRQWVLWLTMSAYVGCGTDQGYQKHRRRGETPCGDCMTAHAQAKQDHKSRQLQQNLRNGSESDTTPVYV